MWFIPASPGSTGAAQEEHSKNRTETFSRQTSHQKSFDGPLRVSPWPGGTESRGRLSRGSSSQHGCVQIKPHPLLSAADPVTESQSEDRTAAFSGDRLSVNPHRRTFQPSGPAAGTTLGGCDALGRQALTEQVVSGRGESPEGYSWNQPKPTLYLSPIPEGNHAPSRCHLQKHLSTSTPSRAAPLSRFP